MWKRFLIWGFVLNVCIGTAMDGADIQTIVYRPMSSLNCSHDLINLIKLHCCSSSYQNTGTSMCLVTSGVERPTQILPDVRNHGNNSNSTRQKECCPTLDAGELAHQVCQQCHEKKSCTLPDVSYSRQFNISYSCVMEGTTMHYLRLMTMIGVILCLVVIAAIVASVLLVNKNRKRRKNEADIVGYLPANIIVNSGALEQGVPDIFLRNSSLNRQVSLDYVSTEFSRDSDSVGNVDSRVVRIDPSVTTHGQVEPALVSDRELDKVFGNLTEMMNLTDVPERK